MPAARTAAKSRPRNAAATREAILASARKAFVQSGYEGAGVREIAAGAGVSAMLVNRYFGSKEKLFAEVIELAMQDRVILTAETLASPDPATIAAALVEVTRPGATPLDGFLIMHRSGSSQRAAEIGRDLIAKRYQQTLAPALGGEDAQQRAALLIALVSGVQVMRQMIGLPALAKADPKVLTKLLTPIVQSLLEAKQKPR